MKCKELTIKTNGKSSNTKIFVDGKQLKLISNIKFEADVDGRH